MKPGQAHRQARCAGCGPARQGRRSPSRTFSVAKRLPDPAQDVLRRGRTAARARYVASIARTGRHDRRPRLRARRLPRRARAPRGHDTEELAEELREAVGATVPEREPWLICMAGTPGSARRVGTETGSAFPAAAAGASTLPALVNRWRGSDRWAGAEVSLIAQLEARRYAGFRRLVVPVQAGPVVRAACGAARARDQSLPVLADNAAGIVFDLGARAATPARSLLGEVAECAGACR